MDREITHEQYYGQFVTKEIKEAIIRRIGKGAILMSNDPHFNDIELGIWDNVLTPVSPSIRKAIKAAGDQFSLSSLVCIAKEAARQIKEEGQAR